MLWLFLPSQFTWALRLHSKRLSIMHPKTHLKTIINTSLIATGFNLVDCSLGFFPTHPKESAQLRPSHLQNGLMKATSLLPPFTLLEPFPLSAETITSKSPSLSKSNNSIAFGAAIELSNIIERYLCPQKAKPWLCLPERDHHHVINYRSRLINPALTSKIFCCRFKLLMSMTGYHDFCISTRWSSAGMISSRIPLATTISNLPSLSKSISWPWAMPRAAFVLSIVFSIHRSPFGPDF